MCSSGQVWITIVGFIIGLCNAFIFGPSESTFCVLLSLSHSGDNNHFGRLAEKRDGSRPTARHSLVLLYITEVSVV